MIRRDRSFTWGSLSNFFLSKRSSPFFLLLWYSEALLLGQWFHYEVSMTILMVSWKGWCRILGLDQVLREHFIFWRSVSLYNVSSAKMLKIVPSKASEMANFRWRGIHQIKTNHKESACRFVSTQFLLPVLPRHRLKYTQLIFFLLQVLLIQNSFKKSCSWARGCLIFWVIHFEKLWTYFQRVWTF